MAVLSIAVGHSQHRKLWVPHLHPWVGPTTPGRWRFLRPVIVGGVTEHHRPGARTAFVLAVLEAGHPGFVSGEGCPPGLRRVNSHMLCFLQKR